MKHPLRSLARLVVVLGALVALPVQGAERGAAPLPVEARGAIPRAVFEAWLARGPQYLLSQVVPVPVTRDKRFLGFRLSRWFPAHPEVTEGAVRQGDVVLRINGRAVERPDQFLYVWKQLPGAATVLIEGARDGAPLKVTLTIVDEPATPPAPEAAPSTP